jgi:hypothetical protein
MREKKHSTTWCVQDDTVLRDMHCCIDTAVRFTETQDTSASAVASANEAATETCWLDNMHRAWLDIFRFATC